MVDRLIISILGCNNIDFVFNLFRSDFDLKFYRLQI